MLMLITVITVIIHIILMWILLRDNLAQMGFVLFVCSPFDTAENAKVVAHSLVDLYHVPVQGRR